MEPYEQQYRVDLAEYLEEVHCGIMILDAMPLDKSLPIVRRYEELSYYLYGKISPLRRMQHEQAMLNADYAHRKREQELRARWLVPLIYLGCSAITAVTAIAVAVIRFS